METNYSNNPFPGNTPEFTNQEYAKNLDVLLTTHQELYNQVVNEIETKNSRIVQNARNVQENPLSYFQFILNKLNHLDPFDTFPSYINVTGAYWASRKILISQKNPDEKTLNLINKCLWNLSTAYLELKEQQQKNLASLMVSIDQLASKKIPIEIDLTLESDDEQMVTETVGSGEKTEFADLKKLSPFEPSELHGFEISDLQRYFPEYFILPQEEAVQDTEKKGVMDTEEVLWSSVDVESNVKMVNKVLSPSPEVEREFHSYMREQYQGETDYPEDKKVTEFLKNQLAKPPNQLPEKISILPSNIPSQGEQKHYGAYAIKDIKRGEILGFYAGEILLDSDEFQNKDKDYFFRFPVGYDAYLLDAKNYGNWTRFINHGNPKHSNIDFSYHFYDGIPYIIFRAKKRIPKGSELLFDYGDGYWKDKGITPKNLGGMKTESKKRKRSPRIKKAETSEKPVNEGRILRKRKISSVELSREKEEKDVHKLKKNQPLNKKNKSVESSTTPIPSRRKSVREIRKPKIYE